ncbi:MAG: TonB-dependent receptor plug domain-containing protein [Erythrobacter sp.]
MAMPLAAQEALGDDLDKDADVRLQRAIDPDAPEALATEPADPQAAATNARSIFLRESFDRFAPRNALDMARQVPGFTIRGGGGARGLGQADANVLINGRRISGKANGPVEALQRITADDVVRLELVDGASLDIGGLTGQVLNVLTASSGRITGQFRAAPQFRSRGTPARLFEGTIGIAGGGAKDEWNLALRNNSNRFGNDGPSQLFDGAGQLFETRDEQVNTNSDRITLGGAFTRVADNGNVLNLNGELLGVVFRETEISRQDNLVIPVMRERLFRLNRDTRGFELGADYEFVAGPGRLKLIGVQRLENLPQVSRADLSFSNDTPLSGSEFRRDIDQGETILRSEYTFPALGGNFVAAVEGALNFLDIDSDLQVRDATGVLQPAPLPGASARVDEERMDAGITYSRALTGSLQLQASAGKEFSRLSQSGPLGQTREFWRPKGFVALDWKANRAFNLAGRIERVVGQLNFFDFIARVDLELDRADASNADLVPPQSWVYELESSIRLGAFGNANLRGFYEDITDIVDQIPVEGGGQAVGNIPAARRYGINGDITLLSDGFGWNGTRVDVRFAVQASEVADPLLGDLRELSNNELVNLRGNLRHDFADKIWALGGAFDWQDFAPVVRLDEISRRSFGGGFASLFVENKNVAGMTVRGTVANVMDRRNFFDRTVFDNRAAGLINFAENRVRRFGTIFTLEIEGSF